MKRIIVSVTNDLATDQRVARICSTLEEMGYELLLVGRRNRSEHTIHRDYKVKRLRLLFNKGFLFYAEYNLRLFFLLLFSKKDMLLSNDLDTLLPNYIISKIQRKKLIFDSHELFSEIPELENRKFVKRFWLHLEKWILPKLKNVFTVSESIQKHYESHYGIKVSVIRNLPQSIETVSIPFDFSTKGKKVILYQGSVNVGRGLELMIDTIKIIEDGVLVIIGSGDVLEALETKVLEEELENKVKFLGRVLPQKLKQLTPNADIGVSLEEDLGLNYRYSLPNKIFDYIQAEVPVIVSNLPEMNKLVKEYKIGEILLKRTPEGLALLISQMIEGNYSQALENAKKELTWKNEKEQLITVIENLE